MTFVALALGANVGGKKENLKKAIQLLATQVCSIQVAPLYQTKPVGFVEQDVFLNTAVIGQTNLMPEELLDFVKGIEKEVGRVQRFRWGPREVDIDILFYGDLIFHNDMLDIPHQRLSERDFVLVPLATIAPDVVHPTLKETVSQLVQKLPKENASILSSEKNWL